MIALKINKKETMKFCSGMIAVVLAVILLLTVISQSDWRPYSSGIVFEYSIENTTFSLVTDNENYAFAIIVFEPYTETNNISITTNIEDNTVYFTVDIEDVEDNAIISLPLLGAMEKNLIRERQRNLSSFSLFLFTTYDLNKSNIFNFLIGESE